MNRVDYIIPNQQLYLCGHSLGPCSKASIEHIQQLQQQWQTLGAAAWIECAWMDLITRISSKLAEILGARSECVTIADSTSVNLYKAVISALQIQKHRKIILTTSDSFPTDLYVLSGIEKIHDCKVRAVDFSELTQHFSEQIAVLVLSHVDYRSGKIHDIHSLTKLAHQHGILVVWDLCHSVGVVPLQLASDDVDFAIGCTYKYLKGGPGSPAFIYVHPRHHPQLVNPITGWMGHQQPFAFAADYMPKMDVHQFQVGTPAMLSLAGLAGALKNLTRAQLAEHWLQTQINAKLICNEKNIGGHVAIVHPQAEVIYHALRTRNIIVDYRPPNLIRICVDGSYVGRKDIELFKTALQEITEELT